jgi:hypothetical protein
MLHMAVHMTRQLCWFGEDWGKDLCWLYSHLPSWDKENADIVWWFDYLVEKSNFDVVKYLEQANRAPRDLYTFETKQWKLPEKFQTEVDVKTILSEAKTYESENNSEYAEYLQSLKNGMRREKMPGRRLH